jgi:hypothetical protein
VPIVSRETCSFLQRYAGAARLIDGQHDSWTQNDQLDRRGTAKRRAGRMTAGWLHE